MPESRARNGNLRAGKLVCVGHVTLLPVDRVVLHTEIHATGAWLSITSHPYTLVVSDANGTRTINIDETAVPLEQLREHLPGLDSALASARAQNAAQSV